MRPSAIKKRACALAAAFVAYAAPAVSAHADLEAEVQAAEQDVVRCFQAWGLEPPRPRLVDTVTVYASVDEARRQMARKHRMPIERVPPTFSGTVEGRALYLISREAYGRLWRGLYPDQTWNERTYRQLIVHELTHKAHENWAVTRFRTVEAMGPAWFYEGLAVACAGQFPSEAPPMTSEALRVAVGGGRTPAGSYPAYGRIVRSLAAAYGMRAVVEAAARPNFPDSLWVGEAPSPG